MRFKGLENESMSFILCSNCSWHALCIWNMGRDANDINCSPHLDGFMDASSTLPPIPLGFLNLMTSEKGDFFLSFRKNTYVLMGRIPAVQLTVLQA